MSRMTAVSAVVVLLATRSFGASGWPGNDSDDTEAYPHEVLNLNAVGRLPVERSSRQPWIGAGSSTTMIFALISPNDRSAIIRHARIAFEVSGLEVPRQNGHGALQASPPNDPMVVEQWYLFGPNDKRGSPGSINAIEAWQRIRPAKPIIVALLDTGVNYTHPDLEANIWKNEREILNGKDDDGNGYIDDLWGWDFAYANNHPFSRRDRKFPDQFDHGTALASLIGAVADNGIGTVGVGRNVKIMNLRVGGDPEIEGQKSASMETTLPEAIRYATRNGAKVIACAIFPIRDANGAVEIALKEAEKAGVLFVRSAGNQHRNIDEDRDYQWLAPFSNVVLVGGTTRDGTLSPHMNFGLRVGIAAPSVDMVFPSYDGYERAKGPGTSFSAAIVAGVAGTLLSQQTNLTPAQVIAKLRESAVVAPGMKGVIDGGRLDMGKLFRP
jgi:subtilisin family serine protease